MMMRPQMAQIPSTLKVSAGSVNFDRRLPMHAGYRTFDAMLVGASGGFGGRSYRISANYSYGGGPGGGGMLRTRGNLETLLADVSALVAGVAGGNGADVGTNATGGTGATGGTSSFNGLSAFGGKGGQGGRTSNSGGLGDSYKISNGGDGGDNSLGLGSVGQGSTGDVDFTSPNHWAATTGVAAVSGTTVGGGGGGGESGKADSQAAASPYGGASGKTGNTLTAEGTTGIAGVVTSNKGGAGGGANIAPVTGGPAEYYGGYAAGSDPDGVVFLKIA